MGDRRVDRMRYDTSKPIPTHCPICGRALEEWSWRTVDQVSEYPSLVCYARAGRLRTWLYQRFSIVDPAGAHYEVQIPERATSMDSDEFHYDPLTGDYVK